jgi:hypothetical protein
MPRKDLFLGCPASDRAGGPARVTPGEQSGPAFLHSLRPRPGPWHHRGLHPRTRKPTLRPLPKLPCRRAGRPRSKGCGAPSAPPPGGGVRGVPCLLLPAYCNGLSRVLGRRSAPGSGSNCGPGVRQPSSRGSGPDPGALELRPGTRAAERREGPARPRTERAPERRPCWTPATPLRSCRSAAETCVDAPGMRSAAAARPLA